MGKLTLKTDPRVDAVFANYPDCVRDKLQHLRELVIETAEETEGVTVLEETLKWGEPSLLPKMAVLCEWIGKKKRLTNILCISNARAGWLILSG